MKDTPFGPGGKFAGRQTSRLILNGLFLESRGKDKGVYGGKQIEFEGVGIRWFDPLTKTYLSHGYDTDGFVGNDVLTLNGDTWTSTGTVTDSKGKVYKSRSSSTFSSDGKSFTVKGELSVDEGKTWIPWWEETMKRIKK